MGLWDWLRGALKPPEPPPRRRASPPLPEPSLMPADESFLRQLLARLGPIPERNPLAQPPSESAFPEAPVTLGGREFWAAIERLRASGRERTAIELLSRFIAARPDEHGLSARLVELLCDRLEHAEAAPYLERLAEIPAHSLRAHFLLGETREREGELAAARRHYERIVAVDLDYPKARSRAERLRPKSETPHFAAAAETIAGILRAGVDVSSRYRLVRELGRGAAGAVYLARDLELDRDVALKLLHPHAASRTRAEARARSFDEARLSAALRHPGVVAIYDLDEERGLIAMELCAGGTLRDLLQRGRLAPSEALRRGVELAGTLEVVHRAGIVHRDLKPGNLLFRALPASIAAALGSTGTLGDLVLGDFGLAHLGVATQPSATAAAAPLEVSGTLGYMAPEQRRGEVSAAVDLFAVGVILHEMLSGSAPSDRAALLRGEVQFGGALPDSVVTSLGEVVSRTVRELIDRLLSTNPSARPPATHVKQRLGELRWLLDRARAAELA